VFLLTVVTEDVPTVPAADRIEVTQLGNGFHRVVVRYGFMEDPAVPPIVRAAAERVDGAPMTARSPRTSWDAKP
jgi:K+ transporter